MLMQQSMIHGKYHGTLVPYSVIIYMGIGEFVGMGYHVDDMQMMQTVESQLMTSWGCRILGLTALNSLLQYVNWLVWEICSVN